MVNELPAVFSALSDPTRLRVVASLRKNELSAGELADICDMSAPAMSRHLRVLRKAGMVEFAQVSRAEEDARLRIYRLRAAPFLSLADWAAHMRAFWRDRLDEFKEYAEHRPAPPAKSRRRGRK